MSATKLTTLGHIFTVFSFCRYFTGLKRTDIEEGTDILLDTYKCRRKHFKMYKLTSYQFSLCDFKGQFQLREQY